MLAGITTLSRDEQPVNAYPLRVVTPSGKATVVSAVQFLKA